MQNFNPLASKLRGEKDVKGGRAQYEGTIFIKNLSSLRSGVNEKAQELKI